MINVVTYLSPHKVIPYAIRYIDLVLLWPVDNDEKNEVWKS